eukprot:PhF_6_TR44471/c0_g1_i2/m.68464/K12592/C1D, LRP1; exosome complex protein LRP1
MEPEVETALKSFDVAITGLEEIISPMIQHSAAWSQNLELSEKARLEVARAYAVAACYFSYLKAQNIPIEDSTLKILTTVHDYLRKVKDADEIAKGPKMKLNKQAAKRLLDERSDNTAKKKA